MKYSVTFHDLVTDISIDPSVRFKQLRFVYGRVGGLVNQDNGKTYPVIRGIEVFSELDDEPKAGRGRFELLDNALYIAEEAFTALVAKTQCSCYLVRPYTCTFNDKKYIQEEGFWRGILPRENIITGGEVFLDEAPYLDEEKNFHPMFHFYRAAKDETNTTDYRALNAWRFLEALHGKADSKLKEHLIEIEHQPAEIVNSFYAKVRCAIAHAQRIKNDPTSDQVILPRSWETQSNGSLAYDLFRILQYLDSVVKKLDPLVTDIVR